VDLKGREQDDAALRFAREHELPLCGAWSEPPEHLRQPDEADLLIVLEPSVAGQQAA
jgi:hypothetical protein